MIGRSVPLEYQLRGHLEVVPLLLRQVHLNGHDMVVVVLHGVHPRSFLFIQLIVQLMSMNMPHDLLPNGEVQQSCVATAEWGKCTLFILRWWGRIPPGCVRPRTLRSSGRLLFGSPMRSHSHLSLSLCSRPSFGGLSSSTGLTGRCGPASHPPRCIPWFPSLGSDGESHGSEPCMLPVTPLGKNVLLCPMLFEVAVGAQNDTLFNLFQNPITTPTIYNSKAYFYILLGWV